MISYHALEKEKEIIKRMSLKELFSYGEKVYYSILKLKAKEQSKDYVENELDGDRFYINKRILEQINLTIFNKVVGTNVFDENCLKYFDSDFDKLARRSCLYNEYVDKALCTYFFQNLDKNNCFCKEVVALYLSKRSENKVDIEEEVKKWIDLHNSQECKKDIAQDVFSICHYMEGVEKMIDDYVKNKISLEKREMTIKAGYALLYGL